MKFDETICAPATPAGIGAISIIRVSGPDTLAVIDRVVSFRQGCASDSEGYRIKFGTVRAENGAVLDEVLVSIFRAPHSYTGEDSAEISCHASSYISQNIMFQLISAGARSALPGEFTQRAFVNGKMDLAQAEAVADLIASQNEASHRLAMNQLRGRFSDELREMRTGLLDLTSLMELELDFSEEDVEFADRSKLSALLDATLAHIKRLTDSFRLGNAIRNGVPVAIVGATNTGKSTLLNALVGEERAIVSDIAGTTRDTVEESIVIDGTLFRFIDTAGIRDTEESIEKIGIERTFRKIAEADIVLGVIDTSLPEDEIGEQLRMVISAVDTGAQKLIILGNKTDINQGNLMDNNFVSIYNKIVCSSVIQENTCDLEKGLHKSLDRDVMMLEISAKSGIGLEKLRKMLSEIQSGRISSASTTLVSNARHFEALSLAASSLTNVRDGLAAGLPTDLVSQDLREALYHLGSITGEISTDEVLGNIFKKFCIGK